MSKIIVPCNDFETASRNSDAKCFRKRASYTIALLRKNPETCIGCVYNDKEKELKCECNNCGLFGNVSDLDHSLMDDDPDENPRCTKCGSDNIYYF